MGDGRSGAASHAGEPHGSELSARLNWLRAGVLGANDGIVSTAGIVVGVAAATNDLGAIATAGFAGLAAGAMSMALGEYVSVSAQRDSERALLALERSELESMPGEELDELTEIYRGKGLEPALAHQVAVQLTAHDALAAHADAELGIDPETLTSPWQAVFASLVAFTVGSLLPLAAVLLPPEGWRIPVTVVAVLMALVLTGVAGARLGQSTARRAALRNLLGGAVAMAVTFGIGSLVGTVTA